MFRRAAPAHGRVRPDCAYIYRELKRAGVTLQLLWEEYAQVHPNVYRRTQFCEIYRQWARRLRPSMRQVHRAGEKTFIDFSGKRPALVDPRWGGDACKILKRKGLLLLELRDPTLYPTIGWCRECVSACRLAFAPAGLSLFSRSDPVCLLSCARARSRPLRGAGRASEAPRGPLVGTGVARRRR